MVFDMMILSVLVGNKCNYIELEDSFPKYWHKGNERNESQFINDRLFLSDKIIGELEYFTYVDNIVNINK